MNPIDYAKKGNWYKFPEITKDVDTFYIYSTVYFGNEGDPDYATMDNAEMLAGIDVEHAIKSSVFEQSTNVFIPYYRQAGMRIEAEAWLKTGNIDGPLVGGTPYGDIVDALDYYFEHCNGGRPFVIAGHSQGSAIVKMVLKNYFKEHPEYYKRMIAAYPIGYAFTKAEFEAYPHMKFATGECDTGVVVTWNTEGPRNREVNADTCVLQPGSMSINPLNWKLDGTYAPASLNLGSLYMDEKTGEVKMGDVGADAQVFPDRGVVVTHAKGEPMSGEKAEVATYFFGPDGRHGEDYALFYCNIKANVAKRVAAYKENQAGMKP